MFSIKTYTLNTEFISPSLLLELYSLVIRVINSEKFSFPSPCGLIVLIKSFIASSVGTSPIDFKIEPTAFESK